MMEDKWKEMLLDVRPEDYSGWVKWLNEIWEDRDSKRLKNLPITLKETQEWYTHKGELKENEWSKAAGKVPRKTKTGRTLEKWAFVYDRSVEGLEHRIFMSVMGEFIKKHYDNRITISKEDLKSLEFNENDCVVCSANISALLPRFDYCNETCTDTKKSLYYVLIIKDIKELEVEWSFRPVFYYGPKDSTANEYRYVLSRENIFVDDYECKLYTNF